MRRLSLIAVFLFSLSLSAQTIFLQPDTTIMGSPQTLVVYDGTYQQFTAYVEGVNDKGVTISTTGGTLNVASCTVSPCRFTLYSATNGTFTVTAKAHANSSVTASQAIQFSGSPTKIACSAGAPDTSVCHPRFYITPSGITSFQAKAVGGNPMYQALRTNAITNFNADNLIWSWSCAPGTGTGCASGTGLPSTDQTDNLPEGHARVYAQMAAIDPSDPTYNWKAYGRDIWTYAETACLSNRMEEQCFANGNEWSQQIEDWSYTQDLLEYTGYLSGADVNLFRNYANYVLWELGDVNSNGGGAPIPTSFNTTAQFTSGTGQRALGNNYTQSKMLAYVALSLTTDDNTTDDPLIATGAVLGVGNSSHDSPTGTGYAVGNTFHITGGGGTGFLGTVTQVSGGVPVWVTVTTPGTGYNNISNPLATTAVTGTGAGLTVNIFAGNTCGAARGVLCSDYTGGDLHSQWNFFTGAWLLKWYGHADDPTAVYNSLNNFYGNTAFPTGPLPTYSWPITGQLYPALGDGVGGETTEGGYWWHVQTVIQAMAAMHSSGWDDPALFGPQISLEYSSFWDEEMMSQQASWAFFGANGNPTQPGYSLRATGGDTEIAGFTTNDSYQLWANYMTILDNLLGRTDRSSSELWTTLNSAYGGPLGTSGGCSSHCGWVASLTNGIAYSVPWPAMIGLPASDPTASLPADPRTVYPTDLWNDSFNNHQSVRNCWATTCARVEFYGTNGLIDHEHNTQGSFEVMQNGEHITKPRNEFDNYNNIMSRTPYINTASYFDVTATQPFSNACTQDQSLYAGFFGGQWEAGAQKGIVTPLHSEMPNYAADHVDDTLVYNGCDYLGAWNYNDVSGASRDFLWLRGSNQIVVYDRGATGTAAYKATSLIATGAPTISTNTATWLTQSGTQKARLSALLPTGVNPTSVKVLNYVVVGAPHSTLQTGTTMQATCTGFYNDGTSADLTSDPYTIWQTDGSQIAISSSGLVSTVGGVGTGADIQCINNGVKNQGANNGLYSIGFVTVGSSSSGTFSGSANNDQYPDWEPEAVVQISVPSTTSSQFLYTLEWGASSFTPTTATLVQSSAGQGYDCALLGTSQGCFMRSIAAFTGTTVAASGGTTQYFSDMTPNTAYSITGAGTPGSATSDNAGVLVFAATGTGNITVSPNSGPALPPVVLSGGVQIKGGATIQ